MARRFQQQTTYGASGLRDEWHPYEPEGLDTSGWTSADFARYVREENKRRKARGDWTRIRSVEDDE